MCIDLIILFQHLERLLSIGEDVNALAQVLQADGRGGIFLLQGAALQVINRDVFRFCEIEGVAYALGGHSLHTFHAHRAGRNSIYLNAARL